jgi:hypothetical protein
MSQPAHRHRSAKWFSSARERHMTTSLFYGWRQGSPVTIRFAEKVGDILVMGSAKGAELQPFKFYI